MGVIWTKGALTTALLCAVAQGQQSIGRVTLQDASVSGPLEVSEGKARLQGGATIVARDHTAELTLERGGIVNICATSSLHVTSGAPVGEVSPLLFALDQGAIELRTAVVDRDIVITPDLRFSTPTGGPVDLRIRVTNNGDTCVENRGARAPTIEVVEQFGEGRYLIPAGQHVLFEHGSLREVVDRESSPCGCPPTPVVSLAESGVTTNPTAAARAGGMAAQKKEEHPFPAAQSQGLAPTPGVPQVPAAPSGQVKVSATMAYGAGESGAPASAVASAAKQPVPTEAPKPAPETRAPANRPVPAAPAAAPAPAPTPAAVPPAPEAAATPVQVKAPPPPAPPGAHDLAHWFGRVFKRIFTGKS